MFCNTFDCKLFLYSVKSITNLLLTRHAAWQLVKISNILFVSKVTKCPERGRLEKIPFTFIHIVD